MATRCYIGIDGNPIRYIYCHWDGYLGYVGGILYHYYSKESRIMSLIGLGNISNLEEKLDDVECYGEKAYNHHGDYISFLNNFNVQYIYLFKDGEWLVNCSGWDLDKDYVLLKDALGCPNLV